MQKEALQEELHRGNTRANRDRIARWVGLDKKRFAALMEIYLGGDRRESQLAAGVLFSCAEFHPELVLPWLAKIVRRMDENDVHPAVRRLGVWVLQFLEIPSKLQGRVVDACFRYLWDPSQPIAIRVFAMTVLARLANVRPELKRELQQTIDALSPFDTPAFRARLRSLARGSLVKEPTSSLPPFARLDREMELK